MHAPSSASPRDIGVRTRVRRGQNRLLNLFAFDDRSYGHQVSRNRRGKLELWLLRVGPAAFQGLVPEQLNPSQAHLGACPTTSQPSAGLPLLRP